MRPLIGISCSYDLQEGRFFLAEAYVNAVSEAGGVPVILPSIQGNRNISILTQNIAGLLLAGGGDVDPSHFNEEPCPGLGEITPERDKFEILVVRAAIRKKLPVLGICRGLQVLNIACGGTVIQHIPAAVTKPIKHSQKAPRWYPTHRVFLEKTSLLSGICGTECLNVNSFHHQAVKDPAPGFKITGVSSDGITEAMENPKYPFLMGVQWHPECMIKNDSNSRKLFKAFISAADKKF